MNSNSLRGELLKNILGFFCLGLFLGIAGLALSKGLTIINKTTTGVDSTGCWWVAITAGMYSMYWMTLPYNEKSYTRRPGQRSHERPVGTLLGIFALLGFSLVGMCATGAPEARPNYLGPNKLVPFGESFAGICEFFAIGFMLAAVSIGIIALARRGFRSSSNRATT